jgi:hypothetical protein
VIDGTQLPDAVPIGLRPKADLSGCVPLFRDEQDIRKEFCELGQFAW